MWILILTLITNAGAQVTALPEHYGNKEACEKAGEQWATKLNKRLTMDGAFYDCLPTR